MFYETKQIVESLRFQRINNEFNGIFMNPGAGIPGKYLVEVQGIVKMGCVEARFLLLK